jgi:hypothetical protein
VAAIHELRGLHTLVTHKKMLKPFFIDSANGFFKVSVDFRVFDIDILRLEISQNPGENGVLREVTE